MVLQSIKLARMHYQEPTKRRILNAALQVFASHGFETSNVNQIAIKAGVAKGTIYYHFRSKNQILFDLVEITLKDFLAEIRKNVDQAKTSEDKIRAFIRTQCALHVAHPEISMVLVKNYFLLKPVWESLRRQNVRLGQDIIVNCQKDKSCKKFDSRIVAMFFHFFILTGMTMTTLVLIDKSQEEVSRTLEEILTTGLLNLK